jgi:hypothetical protein
MANGEKSGTWGAITNDNLGTVIEDAISGLASVVVVSANQALTAEDGAADQARCAALSLTTTTTAPFNVYVPPVTKLYVITNPSGYTATVYCSTIIGNTTAAGTGVAIPTGKTVLLRATGTDVVEQLNHIVGNLSVGGTASATVFSGPLTGNVTGNVSGNVTGNVTGNVIGNIAIGAGTVTTTNFTITEVGGVLFFKNGSTNIAKLDASGNFTVLANVTAFGSV